MLVLLGFDLLRSSSRSILHDTHSNALFPDPDSSSPSFPERLILSERLLCGFSSSFPFAVSRHLTTSFVLNQRLSRPETTIEPTQGGLAILQGECGGRRWTQSWRGGWGEELFRDFVTEESWDRSRKGREGERWRCRQRLRTEAKRRPSFSSPSIAEKLFAQHVLPPSSCCTSSPRSRYVQAQSAGTRQQHKGRRRVCLLTSFSFPLHINVFPTAFPACSRLYGCPVPFDSMADSAKCKESTKLALLPLLPPSLLPRILCNLLLAR